MGRKAQKAKKKQAWEHSDDDERDEEEEHEETNKQNNDSSSDDESSSEEEQQTSKNNKKKGGKNNNKNNNKKGGSSKAQQQQQEQQQQNAAAASTSSSSSAVRKPVQVIYCPISGWTAEMCEYNGQFAKCKQWHIDHAEELKIDVEEIENEGEKGRKQKQPGDEVLLGNPNNKKNQVKELSIDVRRRTGRKKLTMIKGLEFWGIQPNPVAQVLKKKFSCGTSVVDPPSSGMPATVEVQGENTQQLIALLTGKDYNIPEDAIVLLKEGKPLRQKSGGGNNNDQESSSDDEEESSAMNSKSNTAQSTEELLAHNNRDAKAPRPKGKKPAGKRK